MAATSFKLGQIVRYIGTLPNLYGSEFYFNGIVNGMADCHSRFMRVGCTFDILLAPSHLVAIGD